MHDQYKCGFNYEHADGLLKDCKYLQTIKVDLIAFLSLMKADSHAMLITYIL